ncbi:MAG: NADH-quinone oxidoreductase subunit NuoH [Bryobacteraceae bacterium]|nr:NADH-quinone oxidoreductase subunit NuoH [Bryobacteraceae bacterium]
MEFYIITVIKAALIAFTMLTAAAYMVWLERKVLAHIQLRVGPTRVGPHGLLQPLADAVKLLTKEDLNPPQANTFYYLLAPFLAVMLALVSIAVIPFGPEVDIFGYRTYLQLTDLSIGVLVVLAVSSLSVYGVSLAGWASNSKYALLGGLRSSAQMISYELPLAMAVASPLLIHNSLSFREIVNSQSGYYFGFIPQWSVFAAPFPQIFAFILFLIAAFAETNRVPFDLPEAENELVAGFHTEYSSMKFAAFFTAEYINILTICCVATLLFLGGWTPLWPSDLGSDFVPVLLHLGAAAILFFHGSQPARRTDKYTMPAAGVVFAVLGLTFLVPFLKPILIPLFWFIGKTLTLAFIFIWVRGTLPRFRYDQLMRFAWTFMFPAAVLNLLVTSLLVALTSK